MWWVDMRISNMVYLVLILCASYMVPGGFGYRIALQNMRISPFLGMNLASSVKNPNSVSHGWPDLIAEPIPRRRCWILEQIRCTMVVRCQDDAVADVAEVEGGDLGIVGDDFQDFGDGSFSAAPGVNTVSVFPKNTARLVTAGEETELLVGLHNEGEATLNIIAIKASIHFPFDHHMLVQNLTSQAFYNASVPVSAQATFPYIFAVSKYLQPGSFDLVGTIVYEIDQQPYQNIFYNGTIEVVEAGNFLSIESVFLVTLGLALIGLFGLWAYSQVQQFSKKTKKAPKVEVGTGVTDANMDEWLQGTSYAKSLSTKSKKKK